MIKKSPKTQEKPTVSIVGAGRLGGALAVALASHGYQVLALVARRLSHAQRIAKLLGPRTIALSERQLPKLPLSDLILISTPDDVIMSVAIQLASAQEGLRGARIVLHTSGALSSQVLSTLADEGFATGSLHPLVSITDPTSGSRNLRGAFFCLEGEPAALRVAHQIVNDFGGHAFSVSPESKALYHAAAVLASGHMTALFDIAIEMLKACGLSQRHARTVLLPLVQSAVTNLSTMDPAQALTGTFARGDVTTVKKHLAAIQEQSSPEALAAYVLLGRRSLSLGGHEEPPAAIADQISTLLGQSTGQSRK